jgi:transposase InsO family protein
VPTATTTATRSQLSFDHRLVRLVQETGDATIATRLGVPRSTAAGWLHRAPRPVVAVAREEETISTLRRRVVRLERRCERLGAVLRLLVALPRTLAPDLSRVRVAAEGKARVLRAIDRTRGVLGLRRVLSILGLSASRLRAWRTAARACELADQSSCPGSSPQRLTSEEVARMRDMVTSPGFRHVPTSRLALLAQRLGTVVASASTWCRLARERGWRRPRLRVHPGKSRDGIRASKPDEVWHIDTTLLRLLDGTKAYVHAVIDNFSRRILAWRVADRFDPGNAVAVLVEAARAAVAPASPPLLLTDAGVENVNGDVDALVEGGILKRVLAQTEIRFSNSMIEAFWRSLKHGWLFLHALVSDAKVRRLVEFYVAEHNARLPHSAFEGQTPDEMYFGTGAPVPEILAARRAEARRIRLATNRAARCAVCA